MVYSWLMSIKWSEDIHFFARWIPNSGAGSNKAERNANSRIEVGITSDSSGFFIIIVCLKEVPELIVIAFEGKIQSNYWCWVFAGSSWLNLTDYQCKLHKTEPWEGLNRQASRETINLLRHDDSSCCWRNQFSMSDNRYISNVTLG